MCLAAIGIATSLLGGAAQIGQQQAVYGYQRRIAARNRQLATESANLQYGAVNANLMETQMATGSAQQSVRAEGDMATGRVAAAAAESGVSGRSVNDLFNDFYRQEGEYISASNQNYQFKQAQAAREKAGIRVGYDARMVNSADPARPNLWGEALGMFASAFNTGLSLDRQVGSAGGNSLFF